MLNTQESSQLLCSVTGFDNSVLTKRELKSTSVFSLEIAIEISQRLSKTKEKIVNL